MMNRDLIYNLLRFTLSSDSRPDFNVFRNVKENEWEWAFETFSIHGVTPIVYDLFERMPEEVRPPRDVLMKFISANFGAQRSYVKLQGVSAKLKEVMKANDIKCFLLKGLSLAEYYPRRESRKFLDIDLYAPGAESKVDDAFKDKGVKVDTDFYRHSHMSIAGVLVENHHCLLDVRGRKGMLELDSDLKKMAQKHLDLFDSPGLYYPDADFSLIFNLHHALSHFIYEGISFKFLVDWILFLRKEREHLTTDQMAASLRKHGLLKFAAVMSEVSVRHLGLALEEVPMCIRDEMTALKSRVVERFIDDLFRSYKPSHNKQVFAERINNVRRIINASWKPKEFLGQSALGFVWDKFVPILLGRKFEAD